MWMGEEVFFEKKREGECEEERKADEGGEMRERESSLLEREEERERTKRKKKRERRRRKRERECFLFLFTFPSFQLKVRFTSNLFLDRQ